MPSLNWPHFGPYRSGPYFWICNFRNKYQFYKNFKWSLFLNSWIREVRITSTFRPFSQAGGLTDCRDFISKNLYCMWFTVDTVSRKVFSLSFPLRNTSSPVARICVKFSAGIWVFFKLKLSWQICLIFLPNLPNSVKI